MSNEAGSTPPWPKARMALISVIGLVQVLAYGSSYYLPAVLAAPIARDTGWPLPWVVAGLSIGLLVAGGISPKIGRSIDRRGGRPVLATSSILFAGGLIALGIAPTLPFYIAGWAVM